ncbi:MAG: hypothetical protein ACRYHA_08440 [Janthinobacterium lividum]
MKRRDDARTHAAGPPAGVTASRPQRGFGLIGAVVAVAVLSLLLGTVATRMLHDMRVRQGEILGQEMARLNAAVVDFTRRYPEPIKSAAMREALPQPGGEIAPQEKIARELLERLKKTYQPIAQDHYRLTLSNDKDLQDLVKSIAAARIPVRPLLPERHYVVFIDVHTQGCAPRKPGACAIDSTLYIDRPITRSAHAVDHIKLNAALRQLGPGGGMSLPGNPHEITFSPTPRGESEPGYANPAEGKPAGILLIDNFRRVSHLPFLRTSGGSMHGDIDLGKNDITNVRRAWADELNASQSVTVGDASALPPVQSGGIRASGDIRAGAGIRASGDITSSTNISARHVIAEDSVKGHTLTGNTLFAEAKIASAGTIFSKSDISTDSQLVLGVAATQGAACRRDGALSMNPARLLLQCRRGRWEAVHKEPDIQAIAREVRVLQQREDGRLETREMSIAVGPRYPFQNNFSSADIPEEWDHCLLRWTRKLSQVSIYEKTDAPRNWQINGRADSDPFYESFGLAGVSCTRRRYD